MDMTNFLKRVLLLDSASCLGMGALLLAASGPLARAFGLGETLVTGAGAALVPVGLFILWVGTRAQLRPLLVYLIVAGNLLWVAESLLLLRTAREISTLGTLFVAVQAAAVAGLALLEWIGVRRATQTPAGA